VWQVCCILLCCCVCGVVLCARCVVFCCVIVLRSRVVLHSGVVLCLVLQVLCCYVAGWYFCILLQSRIFVVLLCYILSGVVSLRHVVMSCCVELLR